MRKFHLILVVTGLLAFNCLWANPIQILITGLPLAAINQIQPELSIAKFDDYAFQAETKMLMLAQKSRYELISYLKLTGHFQATVQVHINQDPQSKSWDINYQVNQGPRVTYQTVIVKLTPSTSNPSRIQHWIDRHRPKKGNDYTAAAYERLKQNLLSLAKSLGYFNADYTNHQLIINVQNNQASLNLTLNLGPRYRFGYLKFDQSIFDPKFLGKFSPFQKFKPFNQKLLDHLQENLNDSHYFSSVLINQTRDNSQKKVNINVKLKPVKKHQYVIGLGYGTDTGPRVILGFKNRYITKSGQSFQAQIQKSTHMLNFLMQYNIPGQNPLKDKTAISANKNYTRIDAYDNESTSLGLNQSYENKHFTFNYGILENLSLFTTQGAVKKYRYELLPKLALNFIYAKPKGYFKRGIYLYTNVTGTLKNPLSSTSFLKSNVEIKGSLPITSQDRLISKAMTGAVLTNNLSDLAPQYRFYAGGANGLRGYSFASLGPTDDNNNLIGGKYLVIGQIGIEHHLFDNISVTLFGDAGNAFNQWSHINFQYDSGLGLSWRSPVGPVTFALARTLRLPQNHWHFSMTIGYQL